MSTVRPKVYRYRTSVRWEGERKGTLSCTDKVDIKFATPPEFQGHPGLWSPEDLYVAAANTCFLSTFITFAQRLGVRFLAYESGSEGVLTTSEGKFKFTEITLTPRVTVADEGDVEKARQALAQAHEHCLVANSMGNRVIVQGEVVSR
ncbi:MAG: OsmC family protein [Chloroflexi bacterium]|nr:OsmC family protein [Chloroflexota bacterium]